LNSQLTKFSNSNYFAKEKVDFPTSLKIGAYDPNQELEKKSSLAFSHIYLDLRKIDKDELNKSLEKAKKQNRWLLLTIEPWEKNNESNVLPQINLGSYDAEITSLCKSLESSSQNTLIRFAHEMEIPSKRYKWAFQESKEYINAYRHFVSQCKSNYRGGYYVWSPAGDPKLKYYYPGTEFVDIIGLSYYYFPEYEKIKYSQKRSMERVWGEKFDLVKDFGKEIMIAEFGILDENTSSKRRFILKLNQDYKINKIIFFNSKDSDGVWGDNLQTPNWTLDKNFVSSFE